MTSAGVILSVVWVCLRCGPEPLTHMQIVATPLPVERCAALRADLVAESYRQQQLGFPGWSPVSAVCMRPPQKGS